MFLDHLTQLGWISEIQYQWGCLKKKSTRIWLTCAIGVSFYTADDEALLLCNSCYGAHGVLTNRFLREKSDLNKWTPGLWNAFCAFSKTNLWTPQSNQTRTHSCGVWNTSRNSCWSWSTNSFLHQRWLFQIKSVSCYPMLHVILSLLDDSTAPYYIWSTSLWVPSSLAYGSSHHRPLRHKQWNRSSLPRRILQERCKYRYTEMAFQWYWYWCLCCYVHAT